jgi:hypothetical protein
MTDKLSEFFMNIPDEEMANMQFAMPWQYDVQEVDKTRSVDEDGFALVDSEKDELNRAKLQQACWLKFNRNPQLNTSVRGLVGRLTGMGFETVSDQPDIQELIEEIELDPRNRLYNYWPKFVGRSNIEGELFLCLTCHTDGFIEVDFIDPALIGGVNNNSGIIFHPTKTLFPLFYNVESKEGIQQIPSIFIARYPELVNTVSKNKDYNKDQQKTSKNNHKTFKKMGGFNKFIIAWDRGFLTSRAFSFLRTTLEWLNHYENLKKFEIDHKKSSGSYLWIFTFEDPRAFKLWTALSETDRRKTGIMAKKTPGGTLILPPGVKAECKNPQLSNISGSDTDILEMVASGMNEPSDVMTGSSNGTFASVKASRGPMSDRVSDEVAYFERFLRYDFWGSIFFLRSKLTSFPEFFPRKEAVSFGTNQEPVFKTVKRRPEFLIDISFPISETIDMEARARALLGVKHGNINASLGLPNAELARRMGIGGYGRMRLRKATEDEYYPELIIEADAAAMDEADQENKISVGAKKETTKKEVATKKKIVGEKTVKPVPKK